MQQLKYVYMLSTGTLAHIDKILVQVMVIVWMHSEQLSLVQISAWQVPKDLPVHD